MSGCEPKMRTKPESSAAADGERPLRRRSGRPALGIDTMTFDAGSTGAARAVHAFSHGALASDDRPDAAGGLLPPGGALAGRVFSRLLGDAHDDPPLVPGTRVGAWRIGGMLGSGGCAVVYLADRADGHFDQQVALKVMRRRPGLIELFRRERQILASLRHPAIARLIDGGEIEGGRLWFAMEPVFGERIDEYVRSHRLPLGERLALFEEICSAVAYAHRRQFVHRDIKPANLLVDETGRARLLDFGIATADDECAEGDCAMTPIHASPEQRAGEAVTFASDIYQLGAILRGLVECDDAWRTALPRRLRENVREALEDVIARATAIDPALRQPCATRLCTEVAAVRTRLPKSSCDEIAQSVAKFSARRAPANACASDAVASPRVFQRWLRAPLFALLARARAC
jgi:serine/threonine-protein kinase